MANSSKRKGDKAELEVQGILRLLTGAPVRRMLGAGRLDDIGDIDGLDDTVIQVVSRKDVARGLREKLPEVEEQRERAGALFGVVFARMPGGRYVVAMTPETFAAMWRETR